MYVIDPTFGSADMQSATVELNLIPAKATHFGGTQPVPIGQQDHGGVTVPIWGTKLHVTARRKGHQGHSEQTVDAVAKAISRFEANTRFKDFKLFHIEQAKAFKRDLADQRGQRSGEPLSKATLYATLTALKRFFIWLAGQPGYKSRISYSDAEYFNLSTKETRIAKAIRPARVPTLEQVRHVIQTMPGATDIERRDRALIAFAILTGARDGAIASFNLRHIDISEGKIDQDAREVRTKFSKSFVTTFFPVGDDKRRIILVAPTGAGKTIIAAAIIQAAIAPKSSEATDDF